LRNAGGTSKFGMSSKEKRKKADPVPQIVCSQYAFQVMFLSISLIPTMLSDQKQK